MKPYLLSIEDVKELERYKGAKKGRAFRRTGTSTAIALRTIAEAINKPNQPIKVKDHYNTYQSDKYLLRSIDRLIRKMELNGFVFNIGNNTITFYLYEKDYNKECK